MRSIVLADDHPLLLRGLCDLLSIDRSFAVLGATTSGREALALLREGRAEIGVLDLSMPDFGGMDILRAVAAEALAVKVVFLTAHITGDQLQEAVGLGVWGVLLKETAPELLIECLRQVASGKKWLPEEPIGRCPAPEPADRRQSASLRSLTRREKEVLELVCQGYSNKMVAIELGSSAGTVKVHLQNIYQKLDISNRTELAALSLRARRTGAGPPASPGG